MNAITRHRQLSRLWIVAMMRRRTLVSMSRSSPGLSNGPCAPWFVLLTLINMAAVARPFRVLAQTPTPPTALYSSLYQFVGNNGTPPFGPLIQCSGQDLSEIDFLTCSPNGGNGSGSILRLYTSGNGFYRIMPVYTFSQKDPATATNADGVNPGALISGGDGYYYGITQYGGANGSGTVFRLNATGALTTLCSFSQATSDSGDTITLLNGPPAAALALGQDGAFYGTTSNGGGHALGTVFKVTTGGALTVLHTFSSTDTAGNSPSVGLVPGTDGNLYGATSTGGTNNAGTFFKINASGTLTVLTNFGGSGGGPAPVATLTLASDGNFYGATYSGGTHRAGSVIKLTTSGAYTVLYSFSGTGADGGYPSGGVVQRSSDGALYGTTTYPGANREGTVFKITTGGALTTLYSFTATSAAAPYTNSDGAAPDSALTIASDGNLYGTTAGGGLNGEGTALQISSAGVLSPAFSFGYGSDAAPLAGMIQDADGNLDGTASSGGDNDYGAIFQYVPGSGLTNLYSFCNALPNATGYSANADGIFPQHPVFQAQDGNFYGTANAGGPAGAGTVFKYTPGGTLTVVHAFSALDENGFNVDGFSPGSLIQGDGRQSLRHHALRRQQRKRRDLPDHRGRHADDALQLHRVHQRSAHERRRGVFPSPWSKAATGISTARHHRAARMATASFSN